MFMKIKNLFIIAMTMFVATACNTVSQKNNQQPTNKSLVLYYSQINATRTIAELIKVKVGADIEEIKLKTPYPTDFNQTIQQCMEDMKNGTTPEIEALTVDIANYDTIYLGYPIWFGTFAPPIQTLIDANKFDNKVIVPFCTFGSGGRVNSVNQLKEKLPSAKIIESYGVRNARLVAADAELDLFLKVIGAIAGTVENLPNFSDYRDVTDDDKAIFDLATSNYQMLKMTPKTVSSRLLSDKTEYIFIADNQGNDGSVSAVNVFIYKDTTANAVPEFTAVER